MNRNKICIICQGEGKYKCPICLIYYCSVVCCKQHRTLNCDVSLSVEKPEQKQEESDKTLKQSTEVLDEDKLAKLADSEELKTLLSNKHLKDLLTAIDKSDRPDDIMQKAMQEPLFVEFADACLKVVDPPEKEENNT